MVLLAMSTQILGAGTDGVGGVDFPSTVAKVYGCGGFISPAYAVKET